MLVAAVLCCLPAGTAHADAIVVTKAMTATTVVEISIEESEIVVEMEIGVPDLMAFHNLLPDEMRSRMGLEPAPLGERLALFFAEDLVIRADGGALLPGRVRFNPRGGQLLNGTWSSSGETIGSDFDFSSTNVDYNLYHELNPSSVVAGRATLCLTPGDAPFYALCSFGRGNDLRGYVAGRYRDETMVTVQAEYRWNFYKKWGMVAFAGIGQVGGTLSDYTSKNILPSAGIGLRFKLSKTTGFNLSFDYAVGEDSDAWNLYVGESF